jgi:hypothetical protein
MSVCLSVVSVVCCHVGVSASGRSFVQRSHIECVVSGYDREASIMRRALPTGGCWAMGRNYRTELVCCKVDCFNLSSEYVTARLGVGGCVGVSEIIRRLCGYAANVRQQ